MDNMIGQIERLRDEILKATPNARLRYEVRLREMIYDVERSGHRVPVKIKQLHSDLLNEAIEAQFDNMPV